MKKLDNDIKLIMTGLIGIIGIFGVTFIALSEINEIKNKECQYVEKDRLKTVYERNK